MKSFLLDRTYKPIVLWSLVPENYFFYGEIPENYHLALCPSENMVIVDIDKKGNKNGFLHINPDILEELFKSYWYYTKSGGAHIFLYYTGTKKLLNKSTSIGIDLRIGKSGSNNGGYVRYQGIIPPQEIEPLIKYSSPELNLWLEELFSK
jgi:hypothetical protein